MDLFLVELNS